jgi:hypothetical protein
MKREINCEDCAKGWRNAAKRAKQDNEEIRIIGGLALGSMLCDGCGDPILPGGLCWAVSVWSLNYGNPYFPWESECIRVLEEKELETVIRLWDEHDKI